MFLLSWMILTAARQLFKQYVQLILRNQGEYRMILPFFPRAAVRLATLVSSNGRHLKSFLYPPHGTLRRSHCRQDGLDSSHFRRLALQVEQPGWAKKTVGREGQRPAHSFMIVGDNSSKWQPRVSPLPSFEPHRHYFMHFL